MFEKTLEKFGIIYSKFIFRKEKDNQQNLTGFLSKANKILILLPSNYEDSQVACIAFKNMKEKLQKTELTIIAEGIRSIPMFDSLKSRVIRISEVHINKFSLPRKTLLDRIQESTFDVAIDLNLDFLLYSAYICKASGARYRIGFTGKYSDIFYNIQFNFNKSQKPIEIYNHLVDYLQKF